MRANLVKAAEAYPWSGQRAYLGLESLPWLTTDWVLGQFGPRLADARAAYRAYVGDGAADGHREEFHRGPDDSRVLAGEEFLERVLEPEDKPIRPPDLGLIVERVCAAYRIRERDLAGASRRRLFSEARGVVGYLAVRSGAATLTSLAGHYNRDLATVSRAVRRIELRKASDEDLANRLRGLDTAIMQA